MDTETTNSETPLLDSLYDRLTGQEDLELELKAAHSALPRDIWETVSAFANTNGGWIVLGIEEKDGDYAVAGVADASAQLNNFYSTLRNPQKISYVVCGANDARVESVEGKDLVVLRIPAASRKHRPVYVGNNPYRGTYLRRNSGDYLCNKQEVDQMMREASADSATSKMLPNYDVDDIDTDSLRRYRRRYQTAQPSSEFNSYEDKEFLRAIDALKRDRETGKEGLTVAGLLMFGKEISLRDWRSRHLIDYRLVGQLEGNEDRRWEDRVAWEGNLFGAFEAIYPKLIKSQPVPFSLEAGLRVDDPPAHVALREALVNLLVHADYSEPDASLLLHSSEGYMFRNPGSSRVLESDLLLGNRSDPRNPELVRMFRFIGLCDEAGTGIPKIIGNWKRLGYRIPTIETGTERYEFSIKLRQIHLISEEDQVWLATLGSNLSEADQLALVIAKYDGDVDNFRLRQMTNQHPADITKVLRSLKARNLLKIIGIGHKAKYELGDAATDNLFFVSSKSLSSTAGPTHTLNRPSRTSNESDPAIKASDRDIAQHYRGIDARTVWPVLEETSAEIRATQRAKPEVREASIRRLMALAPLSLQELINLTGLSKANLHERLRSLMRSNVVAFLYPERPSHPLQKYCLTDPRKVDE